VYKVISIAGSSGVGKTTLAKLLLIHIGNSVHLAGDNYHKWERNNHNWKKYTHLDPVANELKDAFSDLSALKRGDTIKLSKYSHSTGKFTPPEEVESKGVIIHEGLHALYSKELRRVSDLKIFVETDEDLKLEWKISRDTKERGYTREQVLEMIHNRQSDETKYIDPQKKYADIVVKFSKKENKIDLEYTNSNGCGKNLMEEILSLYKTHQQFVAICNAVGKEEELVRHRGGNLSYKHRDKIVITSSGTKLQDVELFKNLSVCQRLEANTELMIGDRPSLELPFHLVLKKNVIHTHPYYVNLLLCSQEGPRILEDLFQVFNYAYVSYLCPGKKLKDAVESCNKEPIIFLENHGLITNSTSIRAAKASTVAVSKACKDWYVSQPKQTSIEIMQGYLYPEAVVYETEAPFNESMIQDILSVGLTPRFLSSSEVEALRLSEEEQYRMAIK